ncbi:MAG: hypothetical protein KatS3mg097_486 [Candidatus Parcubacteria bacterium]|nr:MAG: hypothetical protein KatS3mg097_486 [Candidatus Parcubacteria bacterium]
MKKEISTNRGFTLIELLIVLALISILAAILIVVINPTEIFKKSRDAKRVGDLKNVAQAIQAALTDKPNLGLGRNGNTECIGGSQPTIFSSQYISGTSSFATFTAVTGSPSQAIDGTGWIPVNLTNVAIANLSSYPIDPVNRTTTPAYYYTYACDAQKGFFEIDARMESNVDAHTTDGGDNPLLYEEGSGKKGILPTATGTNFYQNY